MGAAIENLDTRVLDRLGRLEDLPAMQAPSFPSTSLEAE
jgi:hypothetical protein